MPGASGIALLLLGFGLLTATYGESPIAGLAPDDVGRLAAVLAAALTISSWLVALIHERPGEAVRGVLLWGMALTACVGLYAYRFEAQRIADRLVGEITGPGMETSGAGEVTIRRRGDGSYVLKGEANGHGLRFIFDTGANVVVLTAESARALGLDPERLGFSVPVATANGTTLAAPIVLDTLAVGPIVEKRVRALVARPGTLHENLLGLTFLDRLASYEVRQGRLILRGRGA